MEKGLNVYQCEVCGKSIVTNNPHGLVTPAFIRCRATEGCKGTMASAWYRVGINLLPGWEWYQPPLKGLSPELADHVSRGGGVLREIAR